MGAAGMSYNTCRGQVAQRDHVLTGRVGSLRARGKCIEQEQSEGLMHGLRLRAGGRQSTVIMFCRQRRPCRVYSRGTMKA